nr:hypothetical protein [Crenothrix polyspora]
MNKTEIEDDLRPEYDLKNLQVRKTGAGRKSFGDMVRLEPDVIAAFPDAKVISNNKHTIMKEASVQ